MAYMASVLLETVPILTQSERLDSKAFSLIYTNKVTAPQDAHKRSLLQIYLGSNTSEFSAIRR